MKQLLLLTFIGFALSLSAQTILSPDNFLKHNIGEQFTPHHRLIDYYEHVAENSPNVMLKYYGDTYEGRPLVLAFVSTPENLANLEAIRLNHLRKTGLETGKADGKDIAVTWLSFTVHGNEAAGSESAMPVLYELASPNNERTKEWLENSIVILDPVLNPDGNSRYISWYRQYANRVPNPDLNSLEHREPWPNGRVNHYLFDLNRDWAWATQKESQQRLKVYNQWLPHVHADLHEMGINSPYYFAPAAQPYHEYITDWQTEFQEDIGRNHAKYFDEEGWLYYTKEVFDLLYPSYGDTYPVYNGSIGMTYEQGGSGRAGRAGRAESGNLVTLKDRVAHHETTALSTIEVAAKNADRLSTEFEKFYDDAQNNPQGDYKTYIIKGTNSRAKLKRLTELLDLHRIEYGSLSSSRDGNGFDYKMAKNGSFDIEPNDLIISAYQPKGVLTQVLFDPETAVVDSLTYDITAWSLPYAYGFEAYATTDRINSNAEFQLPAMPMLSKSDNTYAYAISWESVADAHFLSQLLQEGIKVRFTNGSFSLEGRDFSAGTLIVNRADNRNLEKGWQDRLMALAEEHEQLIVPLQTGYVDSGRDLGSNSYSFIDAPNVAIVGDTPTFANEFGQVWFYMERELNYPVTVLTMKNLFSVDLDEYDVLILPEGRFRFSDGQVEQLQSWVRGGGKLIAIGRAVSGLASTGAFGLERASSDEGDDENDEPAIYGESTRRYVSSTTPGAIFQTQIDETHPLGYGLGDTYYSLKTGTQSYSYQEDVWNVGYLNNDPISFGFVGENAKKRLNRNMVFGVRNSGRGQVIYLVDNPLYRGFWEQGKLLFANGLFLVD
ncbi:MAG: M14 family metallopeptidase [Bacteroidota bacterium]